MSRLGDGNNPETDAMLRYVTWRAWTERKSSQSKTG